MTESTVTGPDLAAAVAEAATRLIAAVERLPDSRWNDVCPDEGWTYGVTAHHVAMGFEIAAGLVVAVADGQPLPPLTMDDVNAANAAHAAEQAGITRAEVLSRIREKSAAAAAAVGGLSAEQLARVANPIPAFGNQALSALHIAEMLLVGHPTVHAAGMAAVASR